MDCVGAAPGSATSKVEVVFLSMAFGFVCIGETIKNSACHLARRARRGRRRGSQLGNFPPDSLIIILLVPRLFLVFVQNGTQKTAVEEFSMPGKNFSTSLFFLYFVCLLSRYFPATLCQIFSSCRLGQVVIQLEPNERRNWRSNSRCFSFFVSPLLSERFSSFSFCTTHSEPGSWLPRDLK